MSDQITKALGRFAARIRFECLPGKTVEEVKRRFIDTLACLIAGYDYDASNAARRLAGKYMKQNGASIIGTNLKTACDYAAFANGTAVRYLDYNDTYLSVEPLHPSDVIAPLLALAEERRIDTRRLITAIAVAYEVGVILCDEASLKKNGWDHVNYITVAVTVGGANLIGLTEEETEQALALAIVPHAAMRQTRNGEISMWKGAAAANAARNAVFALQLAECGMIGPFAPIEGTMGMNYLMLDKKLDSNRVLEKLDACPGPAGILRTHTKNWAVEYMTQSAIEAALRLKKQIKSFNDIKQIQIDTFQLAYDVLAKDKEKWAPRTRETADHSFPYIILAALRDGEINLDTFSGPRLQDNETHAQMAGLISIIVNEEINALYPEGNPNRVLLHLKDGRILRELVKYPLGHAGNPMNNDQIEEKFHRLTARYIGEADRLAALEKLWDLENASSYQPILNHFILGE